MIIRTTKVIILFFSVFRIYFPICKDRDDYGCYATDDNHPEEIDVTNCFLDITCKHAGNHHAQCHEGGADGIVRGFEFTFGEVHHIEHVGCETEAVAELLNGNGG